MSPRSGKLCQRGFMKTDFYTKVMLTVIAACLVWMCVNGITPAVSAQAQQAPPTRVIVVDEKGVPVSTAQGLRVNVGAQALPVTIANPVMIGNAITIANPTLPVAITSIERRGIWQPVVVDVMRSAPTLMPTP